MELGRIACDPSLVTAVKAATSPEKAPGGERPVLSALKTLPSNRLPVPALRLAQRLPEPSPARGA
jgi:hypothetical protein